MLITDVAFSQRSPLRTRRAAAGGCEEPDRRGKQYPSEAILLRRLLGSQQGAGVPGRPLSFFDYFFFLTAQKENVTHLSFPSILFRDFLRRVAVEAVMAAELAHAAVDDGLD